MISYIKPETNNHETNGERTAKINEETSIKIGRSSNPGGNSAPLASN
jgi:hypothetical protein